MTLYELFVKLSADNAGLKKGIGESKQTLDRFSKDVEGIGSKLASALPLAAIGAGAVMAAKHYQDASNTIRQMTGATGEQLKSLENSFNNLYKNSERSAEEVSLALAKMAQETKTTGETLEGLTKYSIDFAKVTRTDVGGAIAKTQSLFEAWDVSVNEQKDSLDVLYRVMQATGQGVDELTSGLQSSAGVMRALGFTFKESAVMIANIGEKGINAGDAISTLARLMGQFAKTTEDPKAALLGLIERMKAAESSADALKLAMASGARPGAGLIAFVDAVRRGALDLKELTAEIDKNKDSVGEAAAETVTLVDKMKMLAHHAESNASKFTTLITITAALKPTYDFAIKPVIDLMTKGLKGLGVMGWSAIEWIPAWGQAFAVGFLPAMASIAATSAAIDDLRTKSKRAIEEWKAGGRGWEPLKGEEWKKEMGEAAVRGLGVTVYKGPPVVAPETSEQFAARKKNELSAIEKFYEDYWKLVDSDNKLKQEAKDLDEDLAHFRNQMSGQYLKAQEELKKGTLEQVDVTKTLANVLENQLGPETVDHMAAMRELTEAYRYFGIVTDTELTDLAATSQQMYERIAQSGTASMEAITRAFLKSERDQIASMERRGEAVDKEYKALLDKVEADLEGTAKVMKSVESGWQRLGKQMSTVMTDLSRNLSDLIFKGGKFKDVIASAFEEIGKAITRAAIEAQIGRITGSLTNLIGAIPGIGGVFNAIFGGGGAAVNVPGMVGAGGTMAGSISSMMGTAAPAAGKAAGAAGGLLGTLGAIGSIGSLVTGIAGMFQSAKQETTLNAIEHEVRYSQIHLSYILEKVNDYLPGIRDIHGYLWSVQATYLQKICAAVESIERKTGTNVVVKVEGGLADSGTVAQEVVKTLRLQVPSAAWA